MAQIASTAKDRAHQLARYARAEDIVAFRSGQPVSWAQFTRDVAALASRLPDHKYMLNLCRDRYRFTVGFGAAISQAQITLLPSSDAPGVLSDLREDYPDLYALTDGAAPPVPNLNYPEDLGSSDATPGILEVPDEQPALVLFTSGSTGRPKPACKSWGTLVRSARAAGERLGISGLSGASIIGTVPHQHSFGIESIVMLALQHGLAVNSSSYLYPADIRAAIEASPRPRILVTTPVHLRALLAEPGSMPRADLILSATAPLSAALAAQAETCFTAPLIEIYGCTEAGQIASRRTAQETQWQCLGGVDLDQDSQGTWASGASVAAKTLLHDNIERTGPATFSLGNRSADLVNVAGKRTSLAHLNQQLLEISGVQDGVFVMGQADGRRVARLAALVVAPGLQPGTILQALRQRIDAAFLPRPLVFTDKLPRNALGKLPRDALLRLVGQGRGE